MTNALDNKDENVSKKIENNTYDTDTNREESYDFMNEIEEIMKNFSFTSSLSHREVNSSIARVSFKASSEALAFNDMFDSSSNLKISSSLAFNDMFDSSSNVRISSSLAINFHVNLLVNFFTSSTIKRVVVVEKNHLRISRDSRDKKSLHEKKSTSCSRKKVKENIDLIVNYKSRTCFIIYCAYHCSFDA